MRPDQPVPVDLVRHPATPASATLALHASVSLTSATDLALELEVRGDVSRLRVPPVAEPALVHGLWSHTCLEAFLALDSVDFGARPFPYAEINLAPSGAWAAYAFSAYREPRAVIETLDPRITTRIDSARLVITARIALYRLAPELVGAPLRIGLAAVLEDTDDRLSYWALLHPPGKPDFHHAGGFALRLEAARDG